MQRHIDSLPTSIVAAFEKVSKGAAIIAHKLVLAQKEIAKLKAANKAATRQKLYKRKQVQAESTLIIKDRARLAALKDFSARSNRKKLKRQVDAKVGKPSQQQYTVCKKTRHNARTCKYIAEVDLE
jgi:uncharacterized iron-regulated protein